MAHRGQGPGMRRLDDPDDFVRMEIEAAIERDIPIIPLLVNNATMPTGEDLPPSLRPLTYRNGMPVRPDPDFRLDMERLIAALPKARSPLRHWLLGGAVVAALTLLLTILAIRQRAANISIDGPAHNSQPKPIAPPEMPKPEPKRPDAPPRDAAELERKPEPEEAKAVMPPDPKQEPERKVDTGGEFG